MAQSLLEPAMNLAATDRKTLIRIASALPKGSRQRRAILGGLQKVGLEHDSPEALKKYLKDHPNADKSKHTVKKNDGKKKVNHTLKSDAGPLVNSVDLEGMLKKDDYGKDTIEEVGNFIRESNAEGIERLLSSIHAESEQNVDGETRNAFGAVLDSLLEAGGFWHEPNEDPPFGKE